MMLRQDLEAAAVLLQEGTMGHSLSPRVQIQGTMPMIRQRGHHLQALRAHRAVAVDVGMILTVDLLLLRQLRAQCIPTA
jgi:hypothetical protein